MWKIIIEVFFNFCMSLKINEQSVKTFNERNYNCIYLKLNYNLKKRKIHLNINFCYDSSKFYNDKIKITTYKDIYELEQKIDFFLYNSFIIYIFYYDKSNLQFCGIFVKIKF